MKTKNKHRPQKSTDERNKP
jgi:hypothetical protein